MMRLINEDALIAEMHNVILEDGEDRRTFYSVIERQPTIEERKMGKWIKEGHYGRSYRCNQCGNYLDFDGVNAGRGDANFCPNCGADMRKVEEVEE